MAWTDSLATAFPAPAAGTKMKNVSGDGDVVWDGTSWGAAPKMGAAPMAKPLGAQAAPAAGPTRSLMGVRDASMPYNQNMPEQASAWAAAIPAGGWTMPAPAGMGPAAPAAPPTRKYGEALNRPLSDAETKAWQGSYASTAGFGEQQRNDLAWEAANNVSTIGPAGGAGGVFGAAGVKPGVPAAPKNTAMFQPAAPGEMTALDMLRNKQAKDGIVTSTQAAPVAPSQADADAKQIAADKATLKTQVDALRQMLAGYEDPSDTTTASYKAALQGDISDATRNLGGEKERLRMQQAANGTLGGGNAAAAQQGVDLATGQAISDVQANFAREARAQGQDFRFKKLAAETGLTSMEFNGGVDVTKSLMDFGRQTRNDAFNQGIATDQNIRAGEAHVNAMRTAATSAGKSEVEFQEYLSVAPQRKAAMQQAFAAGEMKLAQAQATWPYEYAALQAEAKKQGLNLEEMEFNNDHRWQIGLMNLAGSALSGGIGGVVAGGIKDAATSIFGSEKKK